jgi:hypothetical protein
MDRSEARVTGSRRSRSVVPEVGALGRPLDAGKNEVRN